MRLVLRVDGQWYKTDVGFENGWPMVLSEIKTGSENKLPMTEVFHFTQKKQWHDKSLLYMEFLLLQCTVQLHHQLNIVYSTSALPNYHCTYGRDAWLCFKFLVPANIYACQADTHYICIFSEACFHRGC